VFTLRATNTGPVKAESVVVTDRLPASATVLSVQVSQGSYAFLSNSIICKFGDLPLGAEATAMILTAMARGVRLGWLDRSYAPGFVMSLVLKDVRLALAEAESAGAPMPSVNVVRDRLITGIARGYGDLDWTALGLVAAEEAGLNVTPLVALN